MPTDAPDGLINSHVVQGRRPDHAEPKTPRKTTHEKVDADDKSAAKKADDDKPAAKKADDKSPTPKAPAKE